jgi:hypothetical protein
MERCGPTRQRSCAGASLGDRDEHRHLRSQINRAERRRRGSEVRHSPNRQRESLPNVQGFADEAHREATSERVHEAHTRLHKAGHCVGGRIFGYKNRTIYKGEDVHGRRLKTHEERVIDPNEAAVVRRIFELYDSGYGLKRIAKMLTDEGSASVKYRRADGLERVEGWATSTVRAALRREMYHGVVVWNKTRKKNDYGKLDVTDRPESEWIRTTVESLRIIDEDLWKRVQSRRDETEKRAVRFESGYLSGRPPKNEVVNLLAGCGECGGGIIVEPSNNKKGPTSITSAIGIARTGNAQTTSVFRCLR